MNVTVRLAEPELSTVSPEAARAMYPPEMPVEYVVEACGYGHANPEDTRLLLVKMPYGGAYVSQIEYVLEKHGMHAAWSRRWPHVEARERLAALRELRRLV